MREPPVSSIACWTSSRNSLEETLRRGRICLDGLGHAVQVGCHADQLLLHTIVQCILDTASLGVGGEHKALARRPQFFGLAAQSLDLSKHLGARKLHELAPFVVRACFPSSPRWRQDEHGAGTGGSIPSDCLAATLEPAEATP